MRVSVAETVNDEKAEVSGQYSGPRQMLSEQAVMETPTPKEIRREALPSTRKRGALKAKGKSSVATNQATEGDILHLRKRKLQLECIKLRLEIKRMKKDQGN